MHLIKNASLIILLAPLLQSAYAEDCQPNGLGGFFCINEDGSTSSSVQNEAEGVDTLHSDGSWTSSIQDGTGMEYTLSNKGLTVVPSPPMPNDVKPVVPSPDESDNDTIMHNHDSLSNGSLDETGTIVYPQNSTP